MDKRFGAVVGVGVLVLASMGVAAPAGGASFAVTNLDDAGPGSLRAALAEASGNGVDDEIVVDPALAGGTILLSSGQLTHDAPDEALTIRGAGVTVDAQGTSRVFEHDSAGLLTIEDLTLTGGALSYADAVPAHVAGAGVRSTGPMSLRQVTIQGNTISSSVRDAFPVAEGAGAWSSAHIEVLDSTLSGNSIHFPSAEGCPGDAVGVGVYSGTSIDIIGSFLLENVVVGACLGVGGGAGTPGMLTVHDSGIGDNAVEGDFFAAGGGLAATVLNLSESAVIGNEATGTPWDDQIGTAFGGGAYVENSYEGRAGVDVDRTSFGANRAVGDPAAGGGLFSIVTGTVSDSSFFGNEAFSAEPGGFAHGGGIAFQWGLIGDAPKPDLTTFRVDGSDFTDNTVGATAATEPDDLTAFAVGGGIAIGSSDDDPVDVVVDDSRFVGNVLDATDVAGAGVAISTVASTSVLLSNLLLVDNVGIPWIAEVVSAGELVTRNIAAKRGDGSCATDTGLDPVGAVDGLCHSTTVEPLPGTSALRSAVLPSGVRAFGPRPVPVGEAPDEPAAPRATGSPTEVPAQPSPAEAPTAVVTQSATPAGAAIPTVARPTYTG